MAKPTETAIEVVNNGLENIDLSTLGLEDILALGQATEQKQQDDQKQAPGWTPVLEWQISTIHAASQNPHIPQTAKGAGYIMLERDCTEDELAERNANALPDVEVDKKFRLYSTILPYTPMGRVQATVVGGTLTGRDKKTVGRVAYVTLPGEEDGKLACSSSNGVLPNPKYIGEKVWNENTQSYFRIGFHPTSGQALKNLDDSPMAICLNCPLSVWEQGKTNACKAQPDFVIYVPANDHTFTLTEEGKKTKKLVRTPVPFEGAFVQVRLRTAGMKAAFTPWQKEEGMISAMHLFESSSGVSVITPEGSPTSGGEERINSAWIYPFNREIVISGGPKKGDMTTQYLLQFTTGEEMNEDLDEDEQVPERWTVEEYASNYLLPLMRYKQQGIEDQFLRMDETVAGVTAAFAIQAPSFSAQDTVIDIEESSLFDDDDDIIVDLSIDD